MTIGNALEEITKTGALCNLQELQSSLMRYCLSITESVWEAEDLAQETCLKAIHLLNGSTVHANPIAYLLRIAKNTRVDQLRKQKAFHIKMNLILPEEQHSYNDIFNLDVEAALQLLIQCLSPMQRIVFLLRDVFGFTNKEAAQILKITEGAVKAALHRARCSLEAAKEAFAADEISNSKVESEKVILRSLIAAFQLRDVPLLVQLCQNDALDPAMAIGMAQRHLLGRRSPAMHRTESMPKLQLQFAA
jgi:RNA polymerase sigma factor (sigma-70 family)